MPAPVPPPMTADLVFCLGFDTDIRRLCRARRLVSGTSKADCSIDLLKLATVSSSQIDLDPLTADLQIQHMVVGRELTVGTPNCTSAGSCNDSSAKAENNRN